MTSTTDVQKKDVQSKSQLKPLVRKICNIPPIPFVVSDFDGRYALLRQEGRYGTDHNHLRGTIVDCEKRTVISGPSYYVIECTQLTVESPTGDDILLHTDTKECITLPLSEISLQYGIGGVNLLVWQDDEEIIHVSSLSRLSIKNSLYGTSKCYTDYLADHHIDLKRFYRVGKISRVVHRLILQYEELDEWSKRSAAGRVCYDGCFVEKHRSVTSTLPVDDEPVPVGDIFDETSVDIYGTTGVFITYNSISFREANDFLATGYYPKVELGYSDPRALPGEFIYAVQDSTRCIYRIKSPAWRFRDAVNVRENPGPNVLLNAFHAYGLAARSGAYSSFNLPTLHVQNDALLKKQVDEGIPIVELSNDGAEIDISTYKGRLYNIQLCLLLAAPNYRQKTVILTLSQYLKSCALLAEEMHKIRQEAPPPCNQKLHNRLKEKAQTILSYCSEKVSLSTYIYSMSPADTYNLVALFRKLRTPREIKTTDVLLIK